jgi:hypothetical protein
VRIYLILFLFIISPFSLGQTKDKSNIKSYDLTGNGQKDRFEYYHNHHMFKLEEDRNGDGKVDYRSVYNDKVYIKIEFQDLNFDGKFERKKSYLPFELNKIKVITERDRDGDGNFEIRYQEITNKVQPQDLCPRVIAESFLEDLADSSFEIVGELNEGFVPTNFGYKIDSHCFKRWGNRFGQMVKSTMQKGLQCMLDLDKYKNPKTMSMTGALRNSFELTQLLKTNEVSIVCSETDYSWEGVAGHASTTSDAKIEKPPVKHPFLSINPTYPKNEKRPTLSEFFDFKKTIFHEQLHNLGYLHGHDVEYPYACESCCFDEVDEMDEEDKPDPVQQSACNICTGDYTSEVDENYIRDIVTFMNKTYRANRGADSVRKYLKENPGSTFGMSYLVSGYSGVFNPVGPRLAALIEMKHDKLSKEEKKIITDAKLFAGSESFKVVTTSSNVLAKVLYSVYYEQNGTKAVRLLSENKEKIKTEMEAVLNKPNGKYISKEIENILNKVIYDLWINKYPTADQSVVDKALEMDRFFFKY